MVITADKNGVTDGPAYQFISRVESKIPIVLVSRVQDYVFNDRLLSLDKYILVCFTEYGWDWDMQIGHIWGKNTEGFAWVFKGDEWKRLDDFIAEHPPVLTFKRELLARHESETVLPIEYPNWQPEHPMQTRDQFNSRRLDLFHYWGFSHPCRKRFQGDAYLHSIRGDITIIDNIFYYQNFLQENHRRYWGCMHIPHFARLPINQILDINGNSKLSLSLPGAGIKCFRSTGESPVNSVMVMHWDDLSWSYEWAHGIDCIKAVPGKEIEAVEDALQNDRLYDVYLNGVQMAKRYQIENYINEYISPNIKRVS